MAHAKGGQRWVRWAGGVGGLGLAGLLVAGGLSMALGPRGAAPATGGKARATALDIATAATMDFDVTTTASGELEAARQIEIRNQLEKPTTIVDIIKEGSIVKAGEVLVKLNADDVQTQVDEETLQVESAKALLASAEAAYQIQQSENESTIRKAALAVEISELELRQWLEGEVASKRQDLALALDKAQREVERLGEKYDRAKGLEGRGFLSKDELKRDELAYLEARAALKTAELDRKVFEEFQLPKDRRTKESAVEEAKAELLRAHRKAESELATKEAERLNRRRQAELRESRLQKLRDQVQASVLRAPGDGMVVYATSMERDRMRGGDTGGLQIGQQVFSNQALIYLPDTSVMVASVRVPESLAGRVRKGQTAAVKVDALAGRVLRGTVESVGILAEQGGWRDPNLREYTVKIRLEHEPGVAIRPSMRCEAEIMLDRVTGVLAIPVQSIFSEGLVRFVHVPAGSGRFVRRPVQVGRRSDRFAEVRAGVAEGERVLVRKPEAREVLAEPWSKAQLVAVGLDLSDDGKVIPKGGAPGEGSPRGENGRGPQADRTRSGGSGGSGGGAAGPSAESAQRPASPGSGAKPGGGGANAAPAPAQPAPAEPGATK
ncbi:MAG: HlyD family efflux transporter periplasmic adaptor subunit [Phycisphaerae bacterium]|nr:HlyD family efflux transporter periplasmic adaptor subunit [Phycisphaerae bacterium]